MAAPRWALLAVLVAAGCANAPPGDPDDACAIFSDNPMWYRDALRAEARWGLPPAMALAFVHRESAYEADAKPARGRLLWVIPWVRPSSAYGYAQATDEAWSDYREATRSWFVERDDFGDALDFIGWYNDRSHRALDIRKDDAYRLYLAYHEGPTGYQRGTWRNNRSVTGYAALVDSRYRRYSDQLGRCASRIDRGSWRF